jgi:hypothetical protein
MTLQDALVFYADCFSKSQSPTLGRRFLELGI